jgi:hypothetical protein
VTNGEREGSREVRESGEAGRLERVGKQGSSFPLEAMQAATHRDTASPAHAQELFLAASPSLFLPPLRVSFKSVKYLHVAAHPDVFVILLRFFFCSASLLFLLRTAAFSATNRCFT